MPLPPEPEEPAPPALPPSVIRTSLTSFILNALGAILLLLAVVALIERNVQGGVVGFAFAVIFFAIARIKDLAESTWARLGRIEEMLEKRSRRR